MIRFPHCKINLGLHITARREDGYHEIETLFYPVRGLCDAVELLVEPGRNENPVCDDDGPVVFSSSGLVVDCPTDQNLCVRAFRMLRDAWPERFWHTVRLHLHKHIPFGAGLGGGSADATAVLQGVNELFGLGLSTEELTPYAARLGSDTAFFLHDTPMIGTGRGERLEPFPELDLSGWWLQLVKPPVGISTAEAYAAITPREPSVPLVETLRLPVETWRGRLVNDFAEPLGHRYPVLREVEAELYRRGAAYAALSGSGSTLFGLFADRPSAEGWGETFFTHIERL